MCSLSASPTLRHRLEIGSILFTCLGAGIEPALDKVERLKHQPVFLPAFALRSGDGNLMNAAGCAGFGHWGDTAYMVQYVSENSPGFFMNNELAHLHNLASVFSECLDTPQTLLLAGESYRSVYAVLSRATPTQRNGKKGFVDYSQAYPQLGIPACLLSCDDTGALQLAIMRQTDYRVKIAQAAFGTRWTAKDDRISEADGQVDDNPPGHRRGHGPAALGPGLPRRPAAGPQRNLGGGIGRPDVRPLRVNHKVLSVAFGGECVLGDPWPDAPLNWKGGLVHVKALRADCQAGGPLG